MAVTTCFDWMSITFADEYSILDIIPYKTELRACKSPIPVYGVAFEALPHGAKILISNHDRLGKHLILSGKVLQSIRASGLSMKQLYEHFKRLNGKFSRVDIALDIVDIDNMSVDDFLKKMNDAKTALCGYKYIANGENAETIYVGNIKSKSRKLRIYNKGLEQNLPILWTRVEYEKRRGANNMASRMFDKEQGIKEVVKSVIDFPTWGLWQEVIGKDIADTTRGEALVSHKNWHDTLNWLCNSAAPALANCLLEEAKENVFSDDFVLEDSVTIDTFISVLNAEIAKKFM